MKKDLTLVILAAGAGKRFWPLSTNKVLFPFFGKPLLHFTAHIPKQVTKIVVVSDKENAERFQKIETPVSKKVVIQSEARGMADALLSAKDELSGSSVITLIADDVVDANIIEQVIAKAQKTSAFGVIVGWKSPSYFPGGYLALDGQRITFMHEKPGAGNEPSPYVNIATHFIDDADVLLEQLEKTKSDKDEIYEKALSALMKEKDFLMVPYEGPFASLKYPWHVPDVMNILFKNLKSYMGENVVIKKNVIIEGAVYIEDGVKIFENTKIVGPCYIGKNSIIGNNNIIRASHIGAGCVTGFDTDITRSYIGDNCWFHSNYIGDSVLEENISLGGGAKLANLRLDDGEISGTGRTKLGAIIGQGVRIGVNASIMPGIKIGKNSFVGSGVILDQDLPDDSYCVASPGYTVTKNRTKAPESRAEFKKKI